MLAALELKRFADLVQGNSRLRVDCFFDLPGGTGSTRRFEPVKDNSTLKLHHMTGDTLVRIRFANKKEAAPLGEAGRVFGRLFLESPLLMLRGDRFILRDPATNTTVGGGIVHLPYPSRDLMPRVSRTTVPKDGGIYETVKGLVGGKGLGFDRLTLGVMLNLRQADLAGRFDEEAGIKREFRITGDFVVNLKRAGALKREIMEALADFHAKDPLAPGMKEEHLFNKLAASISVGMGEKKALFKIILEEMLGEGGERSVLRDGAVIRITSHRPVSKGGDAAVEGALLKLFSGIAPVSAETIGKLPFKKADVRRVMGYLEHSGVVVKLREGIFISAEAVQRARGKLMDHMQSSACIKASEFRDLLGCGRKLAIEILEYFDKSRVTLRKGDVRTLR
jgi:selenocysteine-specific elongation factor